MYAKFYQNIPNGLEFDYKALYESHPSVSADFLRVVQSEYFLLCVLNSVLYSPKTSDATFFEQLNGNIQAALEIFKNVIIVGDFNENLLNDRKHYLKDVLLTSISFFQKASGRLATEIACTL